MIDLSSDSMLVLNHEELFLRFW